MGHNILFQFAFSQILYTGKKKVQNIFLFVYFRYFYYATKEYALANYPDVRVFQLETTKISEEKPGAKSFAHDLWVPLDKLVQTVNDAVSGKPSYTPYSQAQTYKANSTNTDTGDE